MANHKSPLRDRLLSNSPDPIKSSILRESGMGWNSPTSNMGSTSSGSSGSITSPLRIAKRDSPARTLSQPQVARRSSSSYKHVRNNNLVSKSPFKSQIPTPLSTPSRHTPIAFPSPRRVSGEKRPRPSSIHEQAETENERPFSLKRERRQSKGFQGLIQKEPVTRSPFKQRTPSAEEQPPPPLPLPIHIATRVLAPPTMPTQVQASLIPIPAPLESNMNGPSPARSSLVSRRMRGPRLSGGGGRRERRKTVGFDERCDVVEFDRGEETDDDIFDSGNEYGYEPYAEEDRKDDDVFFHGRPRHSRDSLSLELIHEQQSGEKRPQPSSIRGQAGTGDERPFSPKGERSQSEGFQGLIQKEPVTRSPFKQQTPSAEDQPSPPLPLPVHITTRVPAPLTMSTQVQALIPIPAPLESNMNGPSPARSSLISRRMHGPRLSGGGGRRERRKTVTFDERCDVVEFDRDEETDDDVFDSDNEYGYEPHSEEDRKDDDSFFHGRPQHSPDSSSPELIHGQQDDSYESIQLSDIATDTNNEPSPSSGLALDLDASITGIVDEMFFASVPSAAEQVSKANQDQPIEVDTPPRPSTDFNVSSHLEMQDGVPLGRSHHAERLLQYRQRQQSQSPQPPPHFSPNRHSSYSHSQHQQPQGYPFNLNLPTHASPQGPPATPPRRSIASSGAPFAPADNLASTLENDEHHSPIVTSNDQSTPPNVAPTHTNAPPLGRSTHIERIRKAREEEESADVEMLPGSPSPYKKPRIGGTANQGEGLIPKFGLDIAGASDCAGKVQGDDPFDRHGYERRSSDPTDSVNLSIGRSEVSLSSLSNQTGDVIVEGGGDIFCTQQNDGDYSISSEAASKTRQDRSESKGQDMQSEGTSISPHAGVSHTVRSPPSSPYACDGTQSSESEARPRINREDIRRRLTKSQSFSGEIEMGGDVEEEREEKDRMSVITTTTDISAEMATIEKAEKRNLSGASGIQGKEFGFLGAGERLHFDFGSRFGMGGLDLGGVGNDAQGSMSSRGSTGPTESVGSGSTMKLGMGEVDVDMDMRSALDRLMDDVAGTRADDSMGTDEDDSYEHHDQPSNSMNHDRRPMERAATDSALLHNGFVSRNPSGSSVLTIPPPVPPKDNIRNREQLIIEKRREAKRMEEDESLGYYTPPKVFGGRNRGGQELLGVGRPSRRRSMSTGDVEVLGGGAKQGGDVLLDIGVGAGDTKDDALGDSIEKELKKLVGNPRKSKYLIREREGTIYASSSDPHISHLAGPGDVNIGKAWRPVRRPSDMNEYSKQIKEYRAQEKPGKAYGKVFVKVLGIKDVHLPLPQQPTALTCTLNNGIHFVSTPECQLGRDSRIEQEFELIEHSKLEFTLTLKVRRDPHMIAQFKSLAPPPIPAPAPPPVVQTSSKGGMRSFFSSSPKKSSKEKPASQPPPPPSIQRLPENLARYLKPDGTLARAFISFKDIASHCDTRLFETSYPLIGQRVELGGKFSTLQVGEIVLQMFRLPPLPGIAPDKLPQSLEECHRGLRHINWHKVTYFEGTLTQSGGDCSTWRRRQLRVIGANLVAFNDVTKKATATIDLKKAIVVEDDQEARNNALTPNGLKARSSRYADEYDGLYGVERSFRLIFPQEQEIIFFADTDEEKTRWLEVLRALVGHIPPHPLWAELLWQRQEELAKNTQPVLSSYPVVARSPPPTRRDQHR